MRWWSTCSFFIPSVLRIRLCKSSEYEELDGNVTLPDWIASEDSPKGRVKKHSLYSIIPKACKVNKEY